MEVLKTTTYAMRCQPHFRNDSQIVVCIILVPLKYNIYIIKGLNCSCLHVSFDPVKSSYKVTGHSVHTKFLWETLGIYYVYTVPLVELKRSPQVNKVLIRF